MKSTRSCLSVRGNSGGDNFKLSLIFRSSNGDSISSVSTTCIPQGNDKKSTNKNSSERRPTYSIIARKCTSETPISGSLKRLMMSGMTLYSAFPLRASSMKNWRASTFNLSMPSTKQTVISLICPLTYTTQPRKKHKEQEGGAQAFVEGGLSIYTNVCLSAKAMMLFIRKRSSSNLAYSI